MKYDMTSPCVNCPFRRDGFIPLRQERVEEIAEGMLSTQGHEFACHKTCGHDEDGDTTVEGDSQHCGGALIFAEKNGNATQMMRICERIGLYNASKLEPNYDLVFDDLDEMLEAHGNAMRRPTPFDRNAPVRDLTEKDAELLRRDPVPLHPSKHKHTWKVTKHGVIPGTVGVSGRGRTGPRERSCACGQTQKRDSKARKWITKEQR